MDNLKSAYELALDRMVLSKYAIQLQKEEEKAKKIERARIDALPDIVRDWEIKQKQFEDGENASRIEPNSENENDIDIVNNPTVLFASQKLKRNIKPQIDNVDNVDNVEGEAETKTITSEKTKNETLSYEDMPEVHWYGNFTTYGGFSRMNRAFAFGLANRGAKIKIDIQAIKVEINDATQKELEILERTDISDKAPKIFGATLPLNMLHMGKKILYTMMETSETLHKDYVERINLFNEVWVPTNFGANLMKNNGVSRPIMVMPLGVDIDRYSAKTPKYNFEGALNEFVFLSVFKWGYRKGYDILLKAYMDEFSSDDNVSLVLVTRCETDPNPNRISEDLSFIRSGIDKKEEELPHIAVYTKPFSEKDMPKVYTASNAYVSISRGEGFCLPVVEAASCGLPVISSNCSGTTDFLTEENSYLVEPSGFAKAKINGYMSKLAKHCRFYEDQSFPEFGEEAILETRKHMRYVYENRNAAMKKAKVLQKLIRENYSWDMAVDRVLNRIKELQ
jgi:glycosyltransferase involved in cell wall biosynthesis